MAIQQKAPASQENLATQDALTYRLTLSSAKKNTNIPKSRATSHVPPTLSRDLINTFIVFAIILGILAMIYLKVQ